MSDASAQCEEVLAEAVALLGGTERPGQIEMARAVAQTFETEGHLGVQAGTGTGKSLGYLVPALLHAVNNDARVVVSTATLALQHQIINKDAPLALQALGNVRGAAPRVEVLKGWQNYVCLHKLNGGYEGTGEDLFTAAEIALSGEGEAELPENTAQATRAPRGYAAQTKRLYEWARETKTGDRDEAPSGISGRAWRQVSLSSLECVGEKCPFRSKCFQVQARERALNAEVVVTNHTMLGLAAAGRATPLPDFDALVVDEAHELAQRVRSGATCELSGAMVASVGKVATRLKLESAGQINEQAVVLELVLKRLEEKRFLEVPAEVQECCVLLIPALKQALLELSSHSEDNSGAKEAAQAAVAKGAFSNLLDTLEAMNPASVESGENVLWLSRGHGADQAQEPRLFVAPLDVAGKLAARIWDDAAVVVTSATLKLGGSFSSVMHSIGLDLSRPSPQTLDVGTPFHPEKQGILYLAADLPAPGRGEHPEIFWDRFVDLVEASRGGALGLFSSRKMAEMAGEVLRERTEYPILVQGEDAMASLVRQMREDTESCLMGTLSLWQGVDLPGKTCRLVIIDRVPFPVPNDPMIEARSQAAKMRGRNPFMEVSVTHAALLMAQGSGRLLRSSSDRGVVAVLDSRLVQKGYGKFIIASMPPLWHTTDVDVVLEALQRLTASESR